MVRQYIGARYVPKFYENSDGTPEWRSGVIYEPLTIVTYNGNSYTSKKNVPAEVGNPSSNPSYWAATGLYNSQVEQLREEVEEYSREVTQTQETVNLLTNRRFIFIGDSWFRYTSGTTYPHFMDMVYNQMGLTQGTDYYELEGGGYGFIGDLDTGRTFKSLLENATITDPDTITDIYVFGGINDRPYTQTTIESAISDFIAYVKTNFENAKVKICCYSWTTNSSYNVIMRDTIIPAYRNCAKYGGIYIPNMEYCMHAYGLLDGIHPTQAAQPYIFNAVMGAILQDNANVKYTAAGSRIGAVGNVPSAIITLADGFTIIGDETLDSNLLMTLDNNVIHASCARNIAFTVDNVSIGLGYTRIATIKKGLIFGAGGGKDVHIQINAAAITASGTVYCGGFLLIANGTGDSAEVYISLNTANITVTGLRIQHWSATFETLAC